MADSQEKAGAMRRCWSALRKPSAKSTCRKTTIIAQAVAEIAGAAPIYRGAAYCQACHRERFTQWSAGIHKVVTCETCHGAAAKHPSAQLAAPPAPVDPRMHSRIAAERLGHVKLMGPAATGDPCTLCH